MPTFVTGALVGVGALRRLSLFGAITEVKDHFGGGVADGAFRARRADPSRGAA
jgi:hypothetical protein